MYIFRVDHLVLNNQLVCTSLGKTVSPISVFLVALVHYPGLWSLRFPLSKLAYLLVSSLFRSCLGSHVGETLMTFPAVTISHQTLCSLGLSIFLIFLLQQSQKWSCPYLRHWTDLGCLLSPQKGRNYITVLQFTFYSGFSNVWKAF